ncbi:type II secretion system protein GspK [Novosphingobium sp.]|uniref:general secretion pathway protein GspK n=1 Tax=Novosphingobium sp. TaxID=1874826 RepID=UPI0026031576|nr:type II secretion system protein GspK [Novosphingobium sp.]
MQSQRPGPRERGYAMLAVVAGIGVMAAVAAGAAAFTATRLDTLEAETTRARLIAAADAGVEIALANLTRPGLASRWAIDGRTYNESWGGVPVAIRIEDEAGKIMINRIDGENIGWLMSALGLPQAQVETLRDSFDDWIDQDDEPRANGAETDTYLPRGFASRNGPPQSVEELGDIRGFTPALVERIARVATVEVNGTSFDKRYADPLAIQVMNDGDRNSPDVIERQREIAGQRPALAINDPADWSGRVVTIIAVARGSGSAQAQRRVVVEITGKPRQPYVLRWGQ